MSDQTPVHGGWVSLRSPDLVPERLRRPLVAQTAAGAKMLDGMDEESEVDSDVLAFWNGYNDLLAIAMIESWSFNGSISLEGLLDLPAKSYDDIQKLVAPFISELMPNFEATDDPKATTAN
jgi:hypothetical protein